MRSTRPRIALAAAPLLVAALSACGGGSPDQAARDAAAAPRPVKVEAAVLGRLPRVVRASGTLAAEEQAVLGFKVGGRVDRLEVDLGSPVVRDQPLARLAAIDFELGLRQAEAAFEQARARLGLDPDDRPDRVDPLQSSVVREAEAVLGEARARRDRARSLLDERVLSQAAFDAVQADLSVAEARHQTAIDEARNRWAVLAERSSSLALARQRLADSVLRAPFDGAIRERQVSPGQYVSPGDPVVTLVRVDPLRLRLEIPEREAGELRAGQEVRLSVTGVSGQHSGTIARLSPALAERSRTLLVEAAVPNPGGELKPGAFATAEVVIAEGEPAVLAPASALQTFAGVEKLLVVQDGKSVEKRVRTGRRIGAQVEIVEGLEAGEMVILAPGSLVGGVPVRLES